MKGIHQFAANLLSYIPAKYYWNQSTSDLVIAKSRRVNFFLKHSVEHIGYSFFSNLVFFSISSMAAWIESNDDILLWFQYC